MRSAKESQDRSEPRDRSRFAEWLEGIIHIDPVSVVSDMWDAFDMWRATRRWSPIRMMIPGMICCSRVSSPLATACCRPTSANETDTFERPKPSPLAGWLDRRTTKSGQSKVGRRRSCKHPTKEGSESAISKAESKAKAEEEAKNAAYADLLFRRVLQLEPNNKNARFFVAYNLGMRGNLDQARGMMQTLAPADEKVYPPAHAWMALDYLGQIFRGAKVDRKELEHHLKIAADYSATSPLVLSAYAQLLESEKKYSEAISMMQRAAARDQSFYLPLSVMQARHNQPIGAKESADRAISHFSASFNTKNEPDADRIAAATRICK